VIFPVTMLGCHRRPQDAQSVFTGLAPASERQNHTTSPSAAVSFACVVKRTWHDSVHRIAGPTFVTTRTPLAEAGRAEHKHGFRIFGSGLFSREGLKWKESLKRIVNLFF
jgi:hypothetical protein